MSTEMQPVQNPKWMTVLGWLISLLPALGLIFSASMKLMPMSDEVREGFGKIGWNADQALGLGILELSCVLVYLFPRSSVLGAILLTGYLGGAVATHVRLGEPVYAHFLLGALIWLGLVLRYPRLRVLLPLGKDPAPLSWLIRIPLMLLAIVVTLVIVVALQPADFRLERSITIDAPPEAVFAQVNDFHKWDAWTPWKQDDPAAKPSFEGPSAGKGAIFKWAGNAEVGEGSMTIIESHPSDHIKIELAFIKPMPSVADVDFTFEPKGKQTVVTWRMSGRRDLLGKAVCFVMDMEKMVGGKYEEGLKKMKTVVEAGRKQ